MGPATTAPRVVLACGEVRTSLLPALQALDSRAAALFLGLRADERVLLSERPNRYGRSPDTLTGVDCPLPSANGARVRAVGTVAARAVLTEGRLLQASAYFEVPAGGPDHRRPWGQYLVRPGVVEPFGKLPHEAVAEGVLSGGRHGDLDIGLIADGLHTRLLRHPLLDHRPPLRSRPTRLRWVALPADPGAGHSIERFTLAEDELRTVRLRVPEGTPSDRIAGLCDDLALHDWLLTTVVRIFDGIRLEAGAGAAGAPPARRRQRPGAEAGGEHPAVVRALRPAVDHLLHLWMPRARVAQDLAPLWDALEERPGFSRQWQTLVQRIRDQLTLHAIPSLHREGDRGP
ncbi:SCO2521 family protein [Streptomyces sp. KMM 9044]|uniref:SCO2521 family protein n=1 Tax=Streptomyces sp. KMM 9044 TaxID=2744474 RepID=UPI002151EA19|nr:SCO2521 family protein [Streptomyces sp. KMM 9044]WAX80161.1 SCO2521 family protein [Streptomyces sp. KMM 9044]